jgi:dihydroorotase
MIGVNLSRRALGRAIPSEILRIALLCRDETGLPLLVGLAEDDAIPMARQLDQLIPGDVVTYCFRSHPWCLFPSGSTLGALERAVDRGVLLDTGHGTSSFDPLVAQRALERGYVPHTISSDLQTLTASAGVFIGLTDVVNKLIDCGLALDEAVAGVTCNPSRVLGLTDGTGLVSLGGRAELSLVDVRDSHLHVTPLAL